MLLLALDERTGSLLSSSAFGLPFGLAGAALLELHLLGFIQLEGKKLIPSESGAANDELLDGLLATLRAANRPRSTRDWVGRFGGSGKILNDPLLDRLVMRGILRREEGRVLWVFPISRFPETDPRPEEEIRARIHRALLKDGVPDERSVALVALTHACELVNAVVEKDERRAAVQRAKTIEQSQPIGSAVVAVIESVRGAVVASVAAAAAAAS